MTYLEPWVDKKRLCALLSCTPRFIDYDPEVDR